MADWPGSSGRSITCAPALTAYLIPAAIASGRSAVCELVLSGVTWTESNRAAGATPRMAFLHELTELTGGTLLDAGSTENLGATFERILDEFRQRYLISYTPAGVSRPGWHRLDVRVKGHVATVKARPGYLAD